MDSLNSQYATSALSTLAEASLRRDEKIAAYRFQFKDRVSQLIFTRRITIDSISALLLVTSLDFNCAFVLFTTLNFCCLPLLRLSRDSSYFWSLLLHLIGCRAGERVIRSF